MVQGPIKTITSSKIKSTSVLGTEPAKKKQATTNKQPQTKNQPTSAKINFKKTASQKAATPTT